MARTTTTAEERLASEGAPAATRGALGSVLGIAVALAVFGNLAAARWLNPPWLSPDRRIIGTKFELLAATAADVVVLGDSSAAFGVHAGVLGEALGARALNLATFGRFEVAGAAWTLDAYLERHPAPRMVVAVFGARTWWLEASGFDLAQLPLEAGYWARRAPTRALDMGRVFEFMLDRWVPLYSQHASVARGLRGRGFGVPERPAIAADGTMALGDEEARWANPKAFVERTVLPELASRAAGVPERQRAAAEALVARAERDGFDLVFVSAPVWAELAAVPEHAAVVAETEAFLGALAAASPRVRLLADAPTFGTEDVENPYHLRGPAAERYTRALAAQLAGLR